MRHFCFLKFIFIPFFICLAQQSFGQITVGSSASNLNNNIGSGGLLVTLNYNNNSCGVNTTTVTLAFPSGISYVPASVAKTAGLATLTIGYVGGSLSNPQFTVSGGVNGSSITFTVSREANCATNSIANDTIYVSNPCISASIGTLANTSKQLSSNYSINSPVLYFNNPAPISNAAIGGIYTRTVTLGNSGLACVDNFHFFTIRNTSSIQLLSMAIGSNTLVPLRVNGDTTFYDIPASLLPSAGMLCNGQTVVFAEQIKVLSCSNLNTVYNAAYGNASSLGANAISQWCGIANTSPVPITLVSGVANFTAYNYLGNNFANMCTAFNYTVTYTNGGNAPMYNVNIENGLGAYYGGYIMDLGVYTINSAGILGSSGVLTPATYTVASGAMLGINSNQYNSDPDGLTNGLADVNGDGIFAELPAGATVTVVINVQYLCTSSCVYGNNYMQASQSNGYLIWADVCGTQMTGNRLIGGPYYYGSPSSITSGLTVKVPPNIIDGEAFDFSICPGLISWNYPVSASGHYWEWKLILPPGMMANNAGYGSATAYTLLPAPTGDTIVLVGNTGTAGLDCLRANLTYNCGSSDTLKFHYYLSYINDITANCRCRGQYVCGTKVFAIPKCNSVPCGNGLKASKPTSSRTDGSLGYTDYNYTTHVNPSVIPDFYRQVALYLDTIYIKGSASQAGTANNAYLQFQINKIGVSDILIPELTKSRFIHKRGGVILNTVNGLSPTNLSVLSNSIQSIYRYNFSTNLSGGQLLNGDSLYLDLRFIVNTPNLPALATLPLGINWKMFNLDGLGNPYTCDDVGWIPLVYPISFSDMEGVYGSGVANPDCNTAGAIYNSTRNSTPLPYFDNEYRPGNYTDSVVVFIPNGYEIGTFYWLDVEFTGINSFTVIPTNTVVVAGGTKYSFINNGSWPTAPIRIVYNYGIGRYFVGVEATCGSPVSAPISGTVYYKKYYYAYSQPLGMPLIASTGSAYVSSYTVPNNLSYPAINRPSISITNQTGTILGAKPQETFDIRINSIGTVNAPNIWIASDANPNITINQIVNSATNFTYSPHTYTVSGVQGSWFAIDTSGIASGTNKEYKVYFTYNTCNPDSIKLYGGFNCSGFPMNNPVTDSNSVCANIPIYIKLNPQVSKFQMAVTQNPKSPSLDLCSNDSIMVVMNSVFPANIVNPIMTFTVPTGVNITAVQAEYPINSGDWQTLTLSSAASPYTVAINTHTAIGIQGLLGTQYGTTPESRQVRVKVIYNTDCSFPVGSDITIIGKGYRVCDNTALAANDNGGLVRTTDIIVTGLETNGATSNIDISSFPAVLNCTNAVIPLQVTPYFQPTSEGDIAVYSFPDNMNYVAGSFISSIPTASFVGVTTTAGITTLTIALPAGVSANTTINYSVAVKACGFCKTDTVIGKVIKNFSGISCNSVACPNFQTILGTDTAYINIYNPVVRIIRDTICAGTVTSITTFTGSASVIHTFSVAGTYTVDVQPAANRCDSTVIFALELSPSPLAPNLADTSLCQGDTLILNPFVPNGQNYTWYNQNGSVISTNTYTNFNLGAGIYQYYVESNEITTAYLCKSLTKDTIKVEIYANPNIVMADYTNPISFCFITGYTFNASASTAGTNSITNFAWSLNGNAIANTDTLNIGGAGLYSLIITNDKGCKDQLQVTVELNPNCSLLIPEIFSPNGDGKNDLFEIKGIEHFPKNIVTIFNRWGNLVYTKNGYKNEWNGKPNVSNSAGDGLLPTGTYYVIIDFGDEGKTKAYHGYVQLEY